MCFICIFNYRVYHCDDYIVHYFNNYYIYIIFQMHQILTDS